MIVQRKQLLILAERIGENKTVKPLTNHAERTI